MKKNIILSILCIIVLLITGCDDGSSSTTSNTESPSLKYTWWQNTDGTVIQLLDNECILGKDGKAKSNVCKFIDNAYDTGQSKITICDSNGFNCDSTDISVTFAEEGYSFYSSYGGRFYYQGTVKH